MLSLQARATWAQELMACEDISGGVAEGLVVSIARNGQKVLVLTSDSSALLGAESP